MNGSKLCRHDIPTYTADFSTRNHVFADLRPYMCTFPDCEDSTKTYRSRLRFVAHELRAHRGRWICHCPFDRCQETFRDSKSQLQHGRTHKLGPITPLPKWIANPVESSDCLFCGERIESGRDNLARHVGRHMENISFAVVTKTYEDWASFEASSHGDSLESQPAMSVHNITAQEGTA